jgi:hypothetical protein
MPMPKLRDDEPQDGYRKIKARKIHKCDNCHKEAINPGDEYFYGEWRGPKFQNTADQPFYCEEQVGIIYHRYRICLACDEILSSDGPIEDMSEYDLPRFCD